MNQLSKINKPETTKEVLNKVFPVQFNQIDIEPATAKISLEIMKVCSKYGITQCSNLELSLVVDHVYQNSFLGDGDIMRAANFFFERFDLKEYGKPFNVRILNQITKPYIRDRKEKYKRRKKEKQLSAKKFIPAPNDGSLERIEKLAKQKNAAFQESKSKKMDKSRREALRRRYGL